MNFKISFKNKICLLLSLYLLFSFGVLQFQFLHVDIDNILSFRVVRTISFESTRLNQALDTLGLTKDDLWLEQDGSKGKFRVAIEKSLGLQDIIDDQRLNQFGYTEQASNLAKKALETMAVKLAEYGRKFDLLTPQEINAKVGIRPIIVAGGFGSRYSPTGLINKTVSYGTQEESNMRLAINGAVGSKGLAPVVLIDDMILNEILKDEILNDRQLRTNLKNKSKDGAFIVERYLDPEKKKELMPENAVVIYGHWGGHGDAFMDAVSVLHEEQEKGTLPEEQYYLTLFGELATTQNPNKANTGLITYLKEVAGDYIITAGAKKSRELIKKGNFIIDDNGNLAALTDWNYIPGVHGNEVQDELKLVQYYINEDNLEPKEIAEFKELKGKYPDKTFEVLKKKYGKIITDDGQVLINATINVFNREVADYFKYFDEDNPASEPFKAYFKNINPDTGRYTILMWDLIHVVSQAVGNQRQNQDNWPIGFVDVVKGPNSLKTVVRHNPFLSIWGEKLKNIVGKVTDLNTAELEELTISVGDNVEFDVDDPEVWEEWLGNKGITLKGKVHLDVNADIGNNVTIEDSYIVGNINIGENSNISGSIIINSKEGALSIGKSVTIKKDGSKADKIIIKDASIGNDVSIEGKGFITEDIAAGETLSGVIGQYPDKEEILIAGDLSPPEELKEVLKVLNRTGYPVSFLAPGIDIGDLILKLGEKTGWQNYPIKGMPFINTDKTDVTFLGPARLDVLTDIFGKWTLDKKNNLLKMMDQIFLTGEKIVIDKDSRVGNATYLEDMVVYRTYIGNGWGFRQSESLGAVFSDNLFVTDGKTENRRSYFIPPNHGFMNTPSFAIDSEFNHAYIGAGSGQPVYLENGRYGYYNQTIEDTVIPETALVENDVNGIRDNEKQLKDKLLSLDSSSAVDYILSGINNSFSEDITVTAKQGRITMTAVALKLIGGEDATCFNRLMQGLESTEYYDFLETRMEVIASFLP